MKQTWLKKLTSSLLAGALALGMAVVPAAAAESNKLVEVDLWHATRNQASMGNVATDNNSKALYNPEENTLQIATNPVSVSGYQSAITKAQYDNSYVGSLVELAGATSVVQVEDEMNFVSWNTEELLELDPDVILLTAHGLPDLAMEMFAEEFTTNDIWKHFRAVQEGRVYQLDYNTFGMSCTFDWPEALEILKEILYDGTYEAYDAEAAYAESGT